MSVVEVIISVTLPVMTMLLLTAVWMLVGEKEGRRYDRALMSMLREHLVKARDVLVGMEARGSNIEAPDLDVFRPSESEWLGAAGPRPSDAA
ncbi:MAG: hypothetical protein OXH20_06820 [bacterium]|nr:hypothetical protein [bacterium]MXZ29650.1 hypothetical protein [Acidimicrobiia bacterium]MDE0667941.1 hypothetical protein [bacterium]MYB23660.1 hypothetical protein [Acidimicrobiia bacterium]MYE68097.1 hypothetical protein [Acidimicrobiia bacterium]